MPNRLLNEKSLYLQQHAENPVDWWPWCDEAFEHAKRENKPVIVSIGYSSCHWCHVMAHECFEDPYIGELMNKHFVCIKVDREERPDIDQIYMEAVQMITQSGGWPLNAFCLPNGQPFFGGTYFPAEDKGKGIVPWPQLLMRIADYYKKKPQELEENAENIVKNLQQSNSPTGGKEREGGFKNEALISAAKILCQTHDDDWGGFGEAPKFPPSMILDFLITLKGSKAVDADPQLSQRLDQVIHTTLKGMAHGGIYDQIGGGFMRYSVDKFWLVPHFEKMLYDNALLIGAYTQGWLQYKDPQFQAIVEETVSFLHTTMLGDEGFGSSIDADSEGGEGSYYVWNRDEVMEILGDEYGKAFCDMYEISEKGNFEEGKSIPVLVEAEFSIRDAALDLRRQLLKHRNSRPMPGFDNKVLLAWNALMIKNLAMAGFYMGKRDWLHTAREIADKLWDTMRDREGRLKSVNYDGVAQFNGYLDDYAFFIEANLSLGAVVDWIDSGSSSIYYDRAKSLMDKVFEHFKDDREVGYFFTAEDQDVLITRKKVWWDNAIPSGNSSLVHGLSGLYALYGDSRYADELAGLRKAHGAMIGRAPNGIAHALAAYAEDAIGVAVLKVKAGADLESIREELASKPYRKVYIQVVEELPDDCQLCVGTECLAPAKVSVITRNFL